MHVRSVLLLCALFATGILVRWAVQPAKDPSKVHVAHGTLLKQEGSTSSKDPLAPPSRSTVPTDGSVTSDDPQAAGRRLSDSAIQDICQSLGPLRDMEAAKVLQLQESTASNPELETYLELYRHELTLSTRKLAAERLSKGLYSIDGTSASPSQSPKTSEGEMLLWSRTGRVELENGTVKYVTVKVSASRAEAKHLLDIDEMIKSTQFAINQRKSDAWNTLPHETRMERYKQHKAAIVEVKKLSKKLRQKEITAQDYRDSEDKLSARLLDFAAFHVSALNLLATPHRPR